MRAPVDEDEAERGGGGGEGGEEGGRGGGGGDGVDGEADGVGGEDVRQHPDRAQRVGVGRRREDQERGRRACGRRRRGAEARVEGVDAELPHHRRRINRGDGIVGRRSSDSERLGGIGGI